MAITALAPWYGSNRIGAVNVGEELADLKWVGVMTCGGMSELWSIEASTILVNDKHENIINLARVAADDMLGPELQRRLEMKLLHPVEHSFAQVRASAGPKELLDIDAAEAYFVAVWMGRSARAGMSSEFTGGPCIRWTGNGGSSATRYCSAVEMLTDFRAIAKRCDFVCMDIEDYLERVDDREGHGLYGDLPFPKEGLKYLHNPGRTNEEKWHERIAIKLSSFQHCRCVMRFYDHPLIRELYPESKWTWRFLKGRDQANGEKPEVLLINGPSNAKKTTELF